jgi:hypothetical protein
VPEEPAEVNMKKWSTTTVRSCWHQLRGPRSSKHICCASGYTKEGFTFGQELVLFHVPSVEGVHVEYRRAKDAPPLKAGELLAVMCVLSEGKAYVHFLDPRHWQHDPNTTLPYHDDNGIGCLVEVAVQSTPVEEDLPSLLELECQLATAFVDLLHEARVPGLHDWLKENQAVIKGRRENVSSMIGAGDSPFAFRGNIGSSMLSFFAHDGHVMMEDEYSAGLKYWQVYAGYVLYADQYLFANKTWGYRYHNPQVLTVATRMLARLGVPRASIVQAIKDAFCLD